MEKKFWSLSARMDIKLFGHKSLGNACGSQESSQLFPGKLQKYSLDELRDITNNFSDKNILGRGGFGAVYKGCLPDGSLVAVKRLLKEKSSTGAIQFQREMEMISMAVHKNLLRLLGFCITAEEMLLVYPFMVNGSVASCLKGRSESKPLLDWGMRKRIAYGTAMALSYLHDHCSPKIIHRDIKPDNILLDEDFEPVVADFGLARLINDTDSHVTTVVCGTLAHIAPEYFTNFICSEKTDVYAYGVLLLEILTGKRVSDIMPSSEREEMTLFDWIKKAIKNGKVNMLLDSDLQGKFVSRDAVKLVEIALLCTHRSPKERPTMSKVVRMLEDCGLVEKRKFNMLSTTGFVPQIKSFSLLELKAATENFSEQNLIGAGSFKDVYKGKLSDGSQVTVERLKNYTQKGELQYQAEILLMKYKMKHPNLLQFLGFSTRGQERLIVYPLLRNGTVASYLGRRYLESSKFDPKTQKKIALGVAKGLAHLHSRCSVSIIHGNVKAESILLEENYNPVVGNYGLCHLINCKDFQPITAVRGTLGHIAPEFFTTKIPSTKTDVFAYGVFLLELLVGERASDYYGLSMNVTLHLRKNMHLMQEKMLFMQEKLTLVNFVRLCLRKFGYIQLNDCNLLQCDIREKETEQLLQLALLCTQNCPEERPTMSNIVHILEEDVGWVKVEGWQKVLESVEYKGNVTNLLSEIEIVRKGLQPTGVEWIEAPLLMRKLTPVEEGRIYDLKDWAHQMSSGFHWELKFSPIRDKFPYLSEEDITLYTEEGALPAIRQRYENWFGKRL